jgi:hypothetical protein
VNDFNLAIPTHEPVLELLKDPKAPITTTTSTNSWGDRIYNLVLLNDDPFESEDKVLSSVTAEFAAVMAQYKDRLDAVQRQLVSHARLWQEVHEA